MENSTDIAKKIEARRLAVIEALQQEEESLSEVEKTLNVHYTQSVKNVLNSLKNNMETQENELIEEKMKQVSQQIEEKTQEVLDNWVTRMETTRKKMSEVRQAILNEDKEAFKMHQSLMAKMKEQREEMVNRWEEANKKKPDYTWVWIILFSMWTLGTMVLGAFLTNNPHILEYEKKISHEEVMQELAKEYTIDKTKRGKLILMPKGEN